MNRGYSVPGGIFIYIVGVLSFVRQEDIVSYFSSVSNAPKLIQLIIWGVTVVLIWTALCFYVGRWLVSKGENTPHEVEVLPIDESERKLERVNGESLVHYFAYLKIINRESVRITNCYAVLKKASPATSDKDITGIILGNESKRLSWSDNQGNSNFEISIGARTGEAHLNVYEMVLNLFQDSLVSSDFCTKGNRVTRFVLGAPNRVVYKIEIEFFGNVGDEALKIKSFVGCVDVGFYQSDGETSCQLTIYEGEPRNDLQVKRSNVVRAPFSKGSKT
jgi:hypothetical protein